MSNFYRDRGSIREGVELLWPVSKRYQIRVSCRCPKKLYHHRYVLFSPHIYVFYASILFSVPSLSPNLSCFFRLRHPLYSGDKNVRQLVVVVRQTFVKFQVQKRERQLPIFLLDLFLRPVYVLKLSHRVLSLAVVFLWSTVLLISAVNFFWVFWSFSTMSLKLSFRWNFMIKNFVLLFNEIYNWKRD